MLAGEVKSMEPLIRNQPGLINILIIGDNNFENTELQSQLEEHGFTCSAISGETTDIINLIYEQSVDIILAAEEKLPQMSHIIKQEKAIPVIGIFNKYTMTSTIFDRNINDFVIKPYEINEIELRIKRLLKNSSVPSDELLIIGDLMIDLAKFEVSVAGKLVALTFKEFELLKFLANNRGRVFTREALLNKVWGFDYFGGDRTVDVHIRRLRSKIEDANHSFIETVRSIGYRFKEDL